MIEQKQWIPFQDIDWNDEKFNRFNLDTRDFCCGYFWDNKPHKDIKTLNKHPYFFLTEEELKTLIERYYDESGGKGEWRMLSIKGFDNWQLKYLRIFRTELGFIVCDSNNNALNKQKLSAKVNQEHLNHCKN